MNDKVILISDFFIDDFVGGAALNDEEIYKLLSERFDVQKIKSRYLYEGFIQENLDSFFIISNKFLTASEPNPAAGKVTVVKGGFK